MKTFIKIFILLLITVSVSFSQMNEQWVARYNGPHGYDDIARAMAVDASGNVYVTGTVYEDTIAGYITKYTTVKYNSSGVQQWTATYSGRPDSTNSASSIGVDAAGNVYVTGWSGGYRSDYTPWDWVTIKYNTNGVQQWVQRWRGLAGVSGAPTAMVVDALGNSYITGFGGIAVNQDWDYVTIKYNTDGVQQWLSSYNYRTGTPPYYNGQSEDFAGAITVDNIGNVYVTGSSWDSTVAAGYHWDIATIKYSPAGGQQWVQRRFTNDRGPLRPNGILTDNLGNVFVSGLYLIKYNSAGAVLWEKFNGNPQSNGGYLFSIVLDGLGDVYAVNYSTYENKTIIKKYNTLGDSLWGRDVGNNYPGYGYKLAFDNCLGYVYLCGTKNATYNLTDFLTVRYNSYGDSLWSATYNGPGNNVDYPNAISTDALGNVYVTGQSYGNGTHQDFATVKYTPSSFFIHTAKKTNVGKPINDNQSTSDSIFIDCSLMNYTTASVKVKLDSIIHTRDSDLEIYLTHNSATDNTVTVDTLVYSAGGTGQNFIGTILNDSASTPISSGTSPFTGSYRPRSPLSQFNGQGINGLWTLRIYDRATGNTGILKAWSIDFLLSNIPIGIHNISNEIPKQFSLSQNYPNPFNPATNIHFAIPKSSFVKLVVYDIAGREVETLVNEERNAGTFNVDWDASKYSSGVYFYKLEISQAGSSTINFTETKKMVLLK